MVDLHVLAAEYEVVLPALLVGVDVEELVGFVGAAKVNPDFILKIFEEYFQSRIWILGDAVSLLESGPVL